MSGSLSQKVVLVTGCSKGGIGFYLCEEFAERGCKVYATSRKVDSMDGFAHSGIEKLVLDVTSDEDVQRVVRTILDAEGRIDVVVNNAGMLCVGPLIDIPLEQAMRTFDTNTFAALRICKAAIPHMAKRKSGLIVNVGSVVGNTPTPWNGLYSASKAALHTLTEVLWMECKPLNIDVMLVAPGSVRSNIATNHAAVYSELPPGSLYSAYAAQIISRLHISQNTNPMPTEKFARAVVRGALSQSPPWYMTLGGNAALAGWLLWLPRKWLLALTWKAFSR